MSSIFCKKNQIKVWILSQFVMIMHSFLLLIGVVINIVMLCVIRMTVIVVHKWFKIVLEYLGLSMIVCFKRDFQPLCLKELLIGSLGESRFYCIYALLLLDTDGVA